MILLFFTVFSFADNVNEFFSSSQFGYTLFDDKVISALRAIVDSHVSVPGMATPSLALCVF